MRNLAKLTTILALGATAAISALAAGAPPVIRKSPEFTIHDPSGKQILLSSYRGKVVVVAFMYTTCPHCQAEAQMLTKISKDMAPRGLQVLGAAFNDNAAVLVPGFVQQFQVGFPVGYASADSVLSYLGFAMERYVVPQVAVIDRNGNIRAQTPAQGDPHLQTESYMRNLIDELLKEAPATRT